MNLQGWKVLRVWRGSVYVRIPRELQQPIAGGCSCQYCKAHRDQVPTWDTLGVPLQGQRRDTWTVHAPEWVPEYQAIGGVVAAIQDTEYDSDRYQQTEQTERQRTGGRS